MQFDNYFKLCKIFKEHGFSLYLVGGTVRDYLLGLPISDFDCATSALPKDIKNIFPETNDYAAKYGSVKLKYNGDNFDITTFREEKTYDDFRHPKEITFINDMKIDSNRRDFTINALYMDDSLKVYDFHDGLIDLSSKTIRMIGDPDVRIKEDPLRILRAERFAKKLGFKIDEALQISINKNRGLLDKLNIDKIKEEERKAKV